MEKGFFGQYSGNARHSRTPVTKKNYRASVADDAAHIHYLKMDIDYDAKHGHSDENMTADEKHISKLAGDMKYDKKHHSPLNDNHPEYTIDPKTGQRVDEFGTPVPEGFVADAKDVGEEASRVFFRDQEKANKFLDLASKQLEGVNAFENMIPGLGSTSIRGAKGAQLVTGRTAGPKGEETISGTGRVGFNRQAVEDEVNRLRKLSIEEPREAKNIILKNISNFPLGDYRSKFMRYIDPYDKNQT